MKLHRTAYSKQNSYIFGKIQCVHAMPSTMELSKQLLTSDINCSV